MDWRSLLQIVLRNLRRMKLRAGMTAMGVVIGTIAIILLVSIGAGLQRFAFQEIAGSSELTLIEVYQGNSQNSGISSTSERLPAPLDRRALAEFRNIEGVESVFPMIYLRAGASLEYQRLQGYAGVRGIDPQSLATMDFRMQSGAARLGNWQVVIGSRIAENLRDPRHPEELVEPPDLLGKTVELVIFGFRDPNQPSEKRVRVRIAGILEQGGRYDYTLFLSLKETDDLNTWASGTSSNTNIDGYDTVLVQVSSPVLVDSVEDQINQSGFTAYSIQSQMRQLNLLFSAIQAVLGAVGGVALLVAGFGIANAMIMAIYERTREIGLMKAVGARNREIMAIFLTEAGLIGMFGGIAGAVIGWLLGKGVGLIAQAYLRSVISEADTGGAAIPNLIYTPLWLILFAVGFSALVGVISGLYPALRATRMDPIQALRYE
jgi:putative ABC transport system permease protein